MKKIGQAIKILDDLLAYSCKVIQAKFLAGNFWSAMNQKSAQGAWLSCEQAYYEIGSKNYQTVRYKVIFLDYKTTLY